MNSLHPNWLRLKDILSVAYVTTLIAIVGAVIAGLQLRYYKKRDAVLDARNQWEKIHKAMLEFRFRREILNSPGPFDSFNMGMMTEARVHEAAHALHMLHGELDRAPDSPLVAEISEYLNANPNAEQWRAPEFAEKFDKFAHEAASKSR
jgi:hypothetical protein